MKTSVLLRFILLGLVWLALVAYIIRYSSPFTLYQGFVIVASGIIVFVPMYKKYIKKG